MASKEFDRQIDSLSMDIRFGIMAEDDWDGPSIKPGELSPENIKWLASWLVGCGWTKP